MSIIPADRFKRDGDTAWLVFKDNEHQDAAFQWDMLDRPCDTCKGRRWSLGDHTPGLYDAVPCKNCVGGRHTFTIKTECACACHRLKSKYPGMSHDVLGQCKRDGSCDDGVITFTVSVVPGMVLPIVDHEVWACSDQSEWPHCIVLGTDDHVIEMTMTDPGEGWGVDIDSFPSDRQPGDTAALLNVKTGDES